VATWSLAAAARERARRGGAAPPRPRGGVRVRLRECAAGRNFVLPLVLLLLLDGAALAAAAAPAIRFHAVDFHYKPERQVRGVLAFLAVRRALSARGRGSAPARAHSHAHTSESP